MTASRFCFRASCRVSSIILASALLASAPGYAQIGQSGAAQAKLVPRTSIMQPSTTGPASSQALGAFLSRTMVKPNLTRVNTGPGIVYTCDPSVATATCNYLNTTVAGYYNATFTNANANIYVQYGSTGLGESQYYFNYLTYTQYATAYGAIAAKSPIQTSADTALSTYDATPYGSDYVWIQPGIARALGATSEVQGGAVGAGLPALGINTSAGYCTAGTTGCYDGLITVTNSLTLYYDNLGGSEPAGEYDFYAVVEHETDEVLGTSSCISTQGTPLSDACDAESGGSGTPSAVDLFRYSSAGNLVLDSSLSTATGAYFSYDGGSTNGAKGIGGSPKFYNTLDNGADYADYALSSPCAPNEAIQDAYGCPGEDGGLTILNDGGSEINILTAVGYQVPGASACTTGNPNPNPNPAALVVPADFNGDCKSDILWRNSSTGQLETWLMNGTALASQGSPGTVSTTSGWSIQATGDFDGDGKSDVLWQNSTTGQVEIWLMNGTTLSSQGSP
ncbi:MAG: NF038122 family metalloprotease, partial [Acidobacteriaceae bacterium]